MKKRTYRQGQAGKHCTDTHTLEIMCYDVESISFGYDVEFISFE